MGNKLAREYQKRAANEADWKRAQTERRPFFKDVRASGIGERRLTIIHCPSFEQGYGWDLREIDDRLRLYRSRVCPGANMLVGYDLLQFSSKSLREYLARLHAIKISLDPVGRVGLDGTTFHLSLQKGWSSIQLSWWEEPQEDWGEIASITAEMIGQFAAAQIHVPDEAKSGG
jgi:hypothetical protein